MIYAAIGGGVFLLLLAALWLAYKLGAAQAAKTTAEEHANVAKEQAQIFANKPSAIDSLLGDDF